MTNLLSICQAVAALNERGKPISKRRLYQLVQAGEIAAVELGGKLHVVDLDSQLIERAREQTARRRDAHRIKPEPVSQTPRRFGNGRRAS